MHVAWRRRAGFNVADMGRPLEGTRIVGGRDAAVLCPEPANPSACFYGASYEENESFCGGHDGHPGRGPRVLRQAGGYGGGAGGQGGPKGGRRGQGQGRPIIGRSWRKHWNVTSVSLAQ